MTSMDNTPDSPAKTPEGYTTQGGNFWTLITPEIWKVLHAVLHLDEAVRLIAEDFGGNVGRERLEHTLRNGHDQVRLFGERVDVAPYLKKAADKVGPIVSTRLRESLRKENASADMVLLVGGGAGFFELAIRDAFPQLKVSTSDTPVFANVRGFWRMGV